MDDLKQEIRRFVLQNFCFDRHRETRDTDSFLETGIVDSTGILELVSFIEQQYSIEVHADELVPENLDSIAKLARFVSSKLAQSAPPAAVTVRDAS